MTRKASIANRGIAGIGGVLNTTATYYLALTTKGQSANSREQSMVGT